MVRKLLLAAAVVWAAIGLLSEMRVALASYDARATPGDPALRGRFGAAAIERLARAVLPARQLVPAGSVVAFASEEGNPDAAFNRLHWTGYLLPELDVGPLDDPAVRARAQYVLTYRLPIEHPRLQPMQPLPAGGRLYRVLPPR